MAVSDVSTPPLGLRDRAMLEFEYSTALRVSELARIKVGDVDLAEGIAAVRLGKGAKDRMLPVGKVAVEWITRYLAESRPVLTDKSRPQTDALFVTATGLPMSQQILGRELRALGRKAGIARLSITCHVFRRTVATEMLRNGAPPAQVAALLGHEDLRSLCRYVSFAAKEVKDAHSKRHPREVESRPAVQPRNED